jgi:diadenosine tetraphosphate (Ap4A) HIT family hydrolase
MLRPHLDNGVCTFCNELRGIEDCNFRRLFTPKELTSRILYQTNHFVSIPGLGPLGDAYILILPLEHYSCFAALPQTLHTEFAQIKTTMVDLLTRIYRTPIVFEHGTVNMEKVSAGCCVEHAHMHVVCTSIDLLDELKREAATGRFSLSKQLVPRHIGNLMELHGWIDAGFGYLYYENQKRETWGFPIDRPVESQFMRRKLARRLGLDDPAWDWLLFPGKSKVVETWRELMRSIEAL